MSKSCESTTFYVASFLGCGCAGASHRVIVNPSSAIQRQYLNQRDEGTTVLLFLNDKQARVEFYQAGYRIKRCGSGTLAAAHVLYQDLALPLPVLKSHAGILRLRSIEGQLGYAADAVPARPSEDRAFWQSLVDQNVLDCLLLGEFDDYCLLELADEAAVSNARVDLKALEHDSQRAMILTAPADTKTFHYVMRYFAPQYRMAESEVTASVNAELGRFWSRRLNKQELMGRQLSARGAVFQLEVNLSEIWVMGKTQRMDIPSQ